MAKKEKCWFYSPSRVPKPKVPELVKIEVKKVCDEFVESVLKLYSPKCFDFIYSPPLSKFSYNPAPIRLRKTFSLHPSGSLDQNASSGV